MYNKSLYFINIDKTINLICIQAIMYKQEYIFTICLNKQYLNTEINKLLNKKFHKIQKY